MSVLVEIARVGKESKVFDMLGKRGEIVEKKTDQRVKAYLVDFGNEQLWFAANNLKRIAEEESAA